MNRDVAAQYFNGLSWLYLIIINATIALWMDERKDWVLHHSNLTIIVSVQLYLIFMGMFTLYMCSLWRKVRE